MAAESCNCHTDFCQLAPTYVEIECDECHAISSEPMWQCGHCEFQQCPQCNNFVYGDDVIDWDMDSMISFLTGTSDVEEEEKLSKAIGFGKLIRSRRIKFSNAEDILQLLGVLKDKDFGLGSAHYSGSPRVYCRMEDLENLSKHLPTFKKMNIRAIFYKDGKFPGHDSSVEPTKWVEHQLSKWTTKKQKSSDMVPVMNLFLAVHDSSAIQFESVDEVEEFLDKAWALLNSMEAPRFWSEPVIYCPMSFYRGLDELDDGYGVLAEMTEEKNMTVMFICQDSFNTVDNFRPDENGVHPEGIRSIGLIRLPDTRHTLTTILQECSSSILEHLNQLRQIRAPHSEYFCVHLSDAAMELYKMENLELLEIRGVAWIGPDRVINPKHFDNFKRMAPNLKELQIYGFESFTVEQQRAYLDAFGDKVVVTASLTQCTDATPHDEAATALELSRMSYRK
ncbi:hypothetical protein FPQ18DRAFT_405601 [Pyronema domesticum]|uniref:Uncharacterized protein n=1 Tax=Pyronema omphalodes (strain CBS 100304) TaxID=1076935 RepID=U4L7W6_PYROM|nr:hypothetical protein FPQ18DRAFT_405601 [Pyronema domesticum]CCX06229.1 Protein of unknown function [Pyronema omphalodes CBS 100304]